MANNESLNVEVVYAQPERQVVVALTLEPGAVVRDAITQSGLSRQFPEIDPTRQPVGIFGRKVALDTSLKDGDRVELYRPLTHDPKQARRELARTGRTMGRSHED
ncbi:MAG TPA: RnfH family protein [Gammaproteobacteria bacterium]|nr:RnfH family protein [Gammaproteobacteria bacterium]